MFAAAGDDDLRRFVSQAVVAFEFVGDGLAEFRDAGGRGVFGKTIGERLGAGVLDVLGRVEIRFTCAKANDVDAVRFHLFGLGINGQRERRGKSSGAARNFIVHKTTGEK